MVGARQFVRQDGGLDGPFYGAQPLQPTQTRAPTGERLRKLSRKETALAHSCPCGRHSSSARTLLRGTCLGLDSSSGPRAENASETLRLVASSSRVSPRSRSRSIS